MSNDLDKIIWKDWTVREFIEVLEPTFNLIMSKHSWKKPFESEDDIKKWCKDNQPYYKKSIPEINNYFINKWKKFN